MDRTVVGEAGKVAVLVVDDQPGNLVAARKVLERLPIEVITAGSGREALGLALRHDLAAILLDVRMPGMDGYEAAALIRGHGETAPVPIIFMSAEAAGPTAIFRGYESGAVDYLLKPIDETLLLSKLRVFVELHQHRRRLVERGLEQKNAELHAALERLRASEERLSAIIRGSPVCIKVVARDGALTDMNPAGLGMLEAETVAQVQARGLRAFVMPEYRAAFDTMQEQVWRGEAATLAFEISGLRGTRRWLDTQAVPLRDAAGAVHTLLGIAHDATARCQAEEDRRRRVADLEQFHRLSVGRELQMIELKREVNTLAGELGRPPPYDLSFVEPV